MRKLDYYWCSNENWCHYGNNGWEKILNSDAPKEAKKSYRHYKRQIRWMHWEDKAPEPIWRLLIDMRCKYFDIKYKFGEFFNKS